MEEQERKRVLSIAIQLVTGQVEKGELNPEDDEALRAAMKQAVADAKAAYRAALEFIS